MDIPGTEERLRLIEASLAVQEAILTAMQAERIEAERLTDSVDRLGLGASALGEALLQVDRNQQSLTRLGSELREVKRDAATSHEVDEKTSAVANLAKQAKRNLFWQMATGLAFLACAVLYIQFTNTSYRNSTYEVCQARSLQSNKIGIFLDEAARRSASRDLTAAERTSSERQLELLREAFPAISCSSLRP